MPSSLPSRWWLPLGALLLLLPTEARAQAPSFPSRVEAVTVDVVVVDKKGQPVSGLRPGDFVVSEDGEPQSITSFDAIVVPDAPAVEAVRRPAVSTNAAASSRHGRSFILLFDDVHLTPPQAYRAKLAAAEFLRSGVRPGDDVVLVASSGAAWWSATMPEGQAELLSILKRLDGRYIPDSSPDRVTEYEAMRITVDQDVEIARLVARRFDSLGALSRERQSQAGTRPADTYENEALQMDPLVRSRAQETYDLSRARNKITLGVMARALRSLAGPPGRRSMILVSQGFVNDIDLKEFKEVVEASRRANVPIYFLNTSGLSSLTTFQGADFGRPTETGDYIVAVANMTRESEGSDNLAEDTGGFVIRNTNDLGGGIARITNESRSFYLLGYTPTKTLRDGKFRKIQVRLAVERKGLQVRARRGYYAPSDRAPDDRKSKDVPVDPVVEQALDSLFDVGEIPLRATAYAFDETMLGKARVLVASELDVSGFAFKEKDGRLTDSVELMVAAQQMETGEYFRYSQEVQMSLLPETRDRLKRTWYPLSREFELPVGSYHARILVRDKNSGRVGSVTHAFEVPDLSGLRLSSTILSDEVDSEGEGTAPRPVLLARRSFPAGTLYCQYSVYGAAKDPARPAPRVTGAYKVLRSDGSVLREAPPTPIHATSLGGLLRFIGINLSAAPPGPYELVLTVRDEVANKTIENREPFTIEAVPAGTADAAAPVDSSR